MKKKITKVAILGLGSMGERIASNLVNSGFKVNAYNRTKLLNPPDDVEVFSSISSAVSGAEVIISMVTDDASSRDVWLGKESCLKYISSECIAIECSTVSKDWIEQLNLAFRKHGRKLVECPVLGSLPQAEAGQLVGIASADDVEYISQARSVIDSFTGKLIKTGSIGMASVLKLTVNAYLAIQVASLGELIPHAVSKGFNRDELIDILSMLPVTSPAATNILGQMKNENYLPQFPINLVEKDLRYICLGNEHLKSNLLGSTKNAFFRAIQANLGDRNISAVIKLNENNN